MNDIPKKRSRVGLGLWLTVGLLVVFAVVLVMVKKPSVAPEEPPPRRFAVRVMRIEGRTLPDVMRLPGRIEAVVDAVLGCAKPGRIAEMLADKGDRVSRDQVLLRLDDRTWRAMLHRAEVANAQAQADFRRWEELKASGAVSDSDYDAVKERMDLAGAVLEEALVHVALCEVRSPADGVVTDRFLEEGEYATEGKAAFRIVNIDRVKVVFDTPERDVPTVNTGDKVEFQVLALGDAVFTAEVAFVAPAGSPGSNAFVTEALAENDDGRLRPGMIAEISLVRRILESAVVVPLVSVISEKGEHVVYTEKDGRAVRRVVRINRIMGHEAILDAGLSEGDLIVVEGHRSLQDGVPLDVRSADGESVPESSLP